MSAEDYKEGLSFDICGEVDWMFFGLQLTGGVSDDVIINKQTNGYGLRLSGKVSKKVNNIKFFVGPFIRYWNIPNSDKVFRDGKDKDGKIVKNGISHYEPKNYTVEAGIKFGVSF